MSALEHLARIMHDANTGRITPDETDPTKYGAMADAILAAGFGDKAEAKVDALTEAAVWAAATAARLGVGRYERGPSGREADLSEKYDHASDWLAGRAEDLRSAGASEGDDVADIRRAALGEAWEIALGTGGHVGSEALRMRTEIALAIRAEAEK